MPNPVFGLRPEVRLPFTIDQANGPDSEDETLNRYAKWEAHVLLKSMHDRYRQTPSNILRHDICEFNALSPMSATASPNDLLMPSCSKF